MLLGVLRKSKIFSLQAGAPGKPIFSSSPNLKFWEPSELIVSSSLRANKLQIEEKLLF